MIQDDQYGEDVQRHTGLLEKYTGKQAARPLTAQEPPAVERKRADRDSR